MLSRADLSNTSSSLASYDVDYRYVRKVVVCRYAIREATVADQLQGAWLNEGWWDGKYVDKVRGKAMYVFTSAHYLR